MDASPLINKVIPNTSHNIDECTKISDFITYYNNYIPPTVSVSPKRDH